MTSDTWYRFSWNLFGQSSCSVWVWSGLTQSKNILYIYLKVIKHSHLGLYAWSKDKCSGVEPLCSTSGFWLHNAASGETIGSCIRLWTVANYPAILSALVYTCTNGLTYKYLVVHDFFTAVLLEKMLYCCMFNFFHRFSVPIMIWYPAVLLVVQSVSGMFVSCSVVSLFAMGFVTVTVKFVLR